ncbi:ATP-binding protein [Streptomyces turgidiscabies]|uniref:ATPase, AAA family n=1 Tax=Streptomyces turgidiscabies (strain Car8) TaxID=698760 RepID=L7FD75_STRT8|nr:MULTISPECIES: AAA family ATPase [Streptomyces]ELP69493.1 ATPase, AAA family [Streptomyces turgidiscabies Car8]MDX3494398.1 AAA family ATPase [Streptomyces turgidiscabies]GAQ74677.1 ATP-dependent zinc metalloprotease FtsH [Streptomyces turgidiscabies]
MTPRTSAASGLLARLSRLRAQTARLVESRSADDPTADDPLRGLYLSEEAVRYLLLRPGTQEPQDPSEQQPGVLPGVSPVADGDDPLARLAGRLGLVALDVHILLAALAPDLDRSFEPLYGYLNDDVGRRRATTGLALDLCGLPVHEPAARARFHPSAPLTALGLLTVEEPERPFPSRQLSVPDRVVAHLLGDDTLDAALAGHVRPLAPTTSSCSSSYATEFADRLAALLTGKAPGDPQPPTVYLREHREGDGLACVTAALHTAGLDALHFSGPEDRIPDLLREARLSGRAVVVSPLPEQPAALVRALTGPNVSDVPVLLTGSGPYDPHWSEDDPLVLEAPRQGAGQLDAWGDALRRSPDRPDDLTPGPGSDPDLGFELAATVAPYRLGADRIVRAARAAQRLAGFDGTTLTADHLRLAARQQSASGLERHARRIRPDVGWEDLVLPGKPLAQLRELALRARHRGKVLGDWRLSAGGGRGRGVLGLFAGESGTGKTLSAEVVAAELGLDLYVVQLSSVVDKYVGETAKNLERIFSEADRTDAVLLFDEADAVFGKRSEVKDAHDKYANMESAYLLQRLESFDGIALLTTNLRANIDEAFTRRLDLVVDFPFPDAGQRLALWRHSLARVPCAPGTDPARVADAFELAGGSIRSAVVTAAYSAAGRGEPVTTADLLEGAEREYRKAGRLVPGEGAW